MYATSYKKASELADMIRSGTYTVNANKQREENNKSFFNRKQKEQPQSQPSELENIAEMIAMLRAQAEEDGKSLRPVSRGDALSSDTGKRLVLDLMADFNLSRGAAAGIVGSLDHETGGFKFMQEIEPVVEGSRGGYGFAQWTGPRRVEFESWAEANELPIDSYEANYGNLKRELTDTPEGKVLEKLRGVDDPATSAKIFTSTFLRPGVVAMGSRVTKASGYMEDDIDD